MPLGGVLIAGAGLGYGVVNGIIQNNKASKIQSGLKDPTFNIPPEFYQNREIARQIAQIGIPQQQYNNAVNGINQNNAAGLATLSRSANPGAGVTSLTRQADNAHAALDASDAAARQSNQRYFIGENAALGNQELAKQQSDVFDKYTRDFNQMQAYRGAGTDSINNAISGAQNLGLTYLNYAGQQSPKTPVANDFSTSAAASQQQLSQTGQDFNNYLNTQPVPQQGLIGQQFQQPIMAGTGLPNRAPFQRQPQYQLGLPQYYGQNWGWPNQ